MSALTSSLPAVVLLLLLCLMPRERIAADEFSPVRVMSFNIRYGSAADGENHWDNRREFVADTIAAFDPDLLGTQETLGFQRDFLASQLSDHDVYGVGRNDGSDEGEMTAVFYRRDRFERLDAGTFWLSETPDQPGSKSWDSSLPRIVSWVKLRDRAIEGSPEILFFNTHFDHRGETARQESAKLIRRRIIELAAGAPAIITGDFNAAEDSVPYRLLFGEDADGSQPLIDTFRAAHPNRGHGEGTFSGFRLDGIRQQRIDWIACTTDWNVAGAGIDRTARDGRTPSDHLPVTAVLRYGNRQGSLD